MTAAIVITVLMFFFGVATTQIAMNGAMETEEAELKELEKKYEGLKVS